MMDELPESILQFGAGNFLRAFADLFVHQANELGQAIGRIVVVQSTGDARARLINERRGRYQVAIRGIMGGETIDRVESCASVSRAIVAHESWDDVLKVARLPSLSFVLSNTTEAGYATDPADVPASPRSFPAKLAMVLHERWQTGLPPLTLLPCELIEDNAHILRNIVSQRAEAWRFADACREWIDHQCHWLCSLVDRIVPGWPANHPLAANDPLLLMCEPFACWALESSSQAHRWCEHPAIIRTDDVKRFFLRKVRILNGAHTALVCKLGVERFTTILDAMNDGDTASWLEDLLFEEIVPTMSGRVNDAEAFARSTLERFRNPFLRHKLSDIALQHAAKCAVRLAPTLREYNEIFGKEPPLLTELLRSSVNQPT